MRVPRFRGRRAWLRIREYNEKRRRGRYPAPLGFHFNRKVVDERERRQQVSAPQSGEVPDHVLPALFACGFTRVPEPSGATLDSIFALVQ